MKKEKFDNIACTTKQQCEMRDEHGFEYANEHCIELVKKVKKLIDDTSVYAD